MLMNLFDDALFGDRSAVHVAAAGLLWRWAAAQSAVACALLDQDAVDTSCQLAAAAGPQDDLTAAALELLSVLLLEPEAHQGLKAAGHLPALARLLRPATSPAAAAAAACLCVLAANPHYAAELAEMDLLSPLSVLLSGTSDMGRGAAARILMKLPIAHGLLSAQRLHKGTGGRSALVVTLFMIWFNQLCT